MTNGDPPVDLTEYRYEVSWSDAVGEYVATCAEFPSLSWVAPDAETALAVLRRLVADRVANMRNDD